MDSKKESWGHVQKLANTTEHMDFAEVIIPFHFCLWEIILLLDFMTKSNP